ncbi:MAG: DUF2213 domain-containing protein [Candidatus Bathyarchaeota archaeon]|nr:DUF2213 domain-containing protein [Candidatus Termiticorpusculum sp.]
MTTEEKPSKNDTRIVFDQAILDKAVVKEDDQTLTMSAVIASEIVHSYGYGAAYKPADELEKMTRYAQRLGAVGIMTMAHPGEDTNNLLVRGKDLHGIATNFQFVKDLIDPKTKRPNRRGVRADITWFKEVVPPYVIDGLKDGSLKDVSIGFVCELDWTSGAFNGEKYDLVQRNIFLQHVAAPVEAGRCPGPICGIGADTSKIQIDNTILEKCPVCRHMKEVGWQTAGQRLYDHYGPDVLEVIDTGKLPIVPETDKQQTTTQPQPTPTQQTPPQMESEVKTDILAESRQIFRQWQKILQNVS